MFGKLRDGVGVHLKDAQRIHFLVLFRIDAVDLRLAPVLRPERLVGLHVLLADEDVLIFWQRGDPFDLALKRVGDHVGSELRANEFDVLVIIVHISDELRKLLDPRLVHRDQFVANDVLGLLAQTLNVAAVSVGRPDRRADFRLVTVGLALVLLFHELLDEVVVAGTLVLDLEVAARDDDAFEVLKLVLTRPLEVFGFVKFPAFLAVDQLAHEEQFGLVRDLDGILRATSVARHYGIVGILVPNVLVLVPNQIAHEPLG